MASVDTDVINRDCQWIDHTWPALLISSTLHKTQPYAIITFFLPANLQTNWITYLGDASWNRNFIPFGIVFLLTWLFLLLKCDAFYFYCQGCAVAQSLRNCAISRKVAGSIPDGVIEIFNWHNSSCRTVALGFTQPLTGMSTWNFIFFYFNTATVHIFLQFCKSTNKSTITINF